MNATLIAENELKPGTSVQPIRTLLAPTDLTEHSNPALKYAISLAEHYHAKLILLNVVELPASGSMLGTVEAEEMIDVASQSLKKIAGMIPPTVLHERIVRFGAGQIAGTIIEVAEENFADLIVITTHGYSGLKRVWHGSMAEILVRHAQCPVLVVRSSGDKTDSQTIEPSSTFTKAAA